MTIKEKLSLLRELMRKNKIQIYYAPSGDYHQSEYVGDYFRCIEYVSGFTGSAGTLVITEKKAGLWTDGRYFIQAEAQLKDTGILLYKLNEPGYPSVLDFIKKEVKSNSVIGFDGKVVSADLAEKLKEIMALNNGKIKAEYDLIGEIWKNRPKLSENKIFILEEKYTGKSCENKIKIIREKMKLTGTTTHIINTLDDIAWIYNIRGNDTQNNPVVLAYSIITMDEIILYVDLRKITIENKNYFVQNNIQLKEYENIYEDINKYLDSKILLDKTKINYSLYKKIENSQNVINKRNISTDLKVIKNYVEIENIRKSHLEDAIAMTKFMFWIKNIDFDKENLTEYDVVEKITEFRKKSKNYIEPSFDTIAAFGENAAMMHYKPTKEKNKKLEYGEFLLVDSGGQYYTGTTDITRTFALETKEKKVPELLKEHFTLVLKGMINLSKARFLCGVTGTNLDVLARAPIWDMAMDYKCGTGHGIGFVLNVHEGPHSIRPAYNPEVLQPGMVVTNEPGIYIENSHGIRIENELLVKEYKKTEFGKFLEFETLTYVPIDIDAIQKKLLGPEEIKFLNLYHEIVYNRLKEYLTAEEELWLRKYTEKI
ncbi:aminopeptidase P family protein [Fusobacterium sp. PH5-44]|uniref:aminopeptidase P family protein n=1 Tax=unclassified Fusobacterium TaxID=2648384 RepID=UPI003D1F954F